MQQLSQIIKNLGFSENEASIYLALMEMGVANVAVIPEKSGVKRTSCYVILEDLVHKGIAHKTRIKGKLHYAAEPPERLLRLAEERRESLKQALPEFKSLFNLLQTKPKVRYYEGKEGYVSICEDSLRNADDEILLMANLDSLYAAITPEYDEKIYVPQRLRLGKAIRVITLESTLTKRFRHHDASLRRETRFLSDVEMFNASLFIYADSVGIVSSEKDLSGLIIESASITALARALFETAWRQAR